MDLFRVNEQNPARTEMDRFGSAVADMCRALNLPPFMYAGDGRSNQLLKIQQHLNECLQLKGFTPCNVGSRRFQDALAYMASNFNRLAPSVSVPAPVQVEKVVSNDTTAQTQTPTKKRSTKAKPKRTRKPKGDT